MITWGRVGDAEWAREAQLLQKLYKKTKSLTMFAVALDEDEDAVRAFAKNNGLTFPVTIDVSNGAERYGITQSRTTMLADADDVIIFTSVGLTEQKMKALEEKLASLPE